MVHRAMMTVCRAMALVGWLVLIALITLVCVSIMGRALNGVLHGMGDLALAKTLLDLGIGPVTGDFELVEAGMAFAIFAFLPLCQITGAHASVDIFTSKLPPWGLRVLKAAIEVLFATVLVIIALQLYEGTQSKMRSGQTTFLLQFPIWWAYLASLFAASLAALVACYMVVLRFWAVLTADESLLETDAQ